MKDASIIELLFSKDEKGITALQEKYGKLLFKVAGNILSIKEDVDECVNEAYLSVWNSIPPQRPENLCAYICKITKRKAINKLKFNSACKRNDDFCLSLQELGECVSSKESVDDVVNQNELSKAISLFLKNQKEIERNLFIRRYWYCESVEKIAKDFHLRENTVSTKLFRLRIKLKNYLMKEGFIDE